MGNERREGDFHWWAAEKIQAPFTRLSAKLQVIASLSEMCGWVFVQQEPILFGFGGKAIF